MIDRENLWVLDSYSDGILKAGGIWNKIDYEIWPLERSYISSTFCYIIVCEALAGSLFCLVFSTSAFSKLLPIINAKIWR